MENSGLVPQPNYVLETSQEKYRVVWKVEGVAQVPEMREGIREVKTDTGPTGGRAVGLKEQAKPDKTQLSWW